MVRGESSLGYTIQRSLTPPQLALRDNQNQNRSTDQIPADIRPIPVTPHHVLVAPESCFTRRPPPRIAI